MCDVTSCDWETETKHGLNETSYMKWSKSRIQRHQVGIYLRWRLVMMDIVSRLAPGGWNELECRATKTATWKVLKATLTGWHRHKICRIAWRLGDEEDGHCSWRWRFLDCGWTNRRDGRGLSADVKQVLFMIGHHICMPPGRLH